MPYRLVYVQVYPSMTWVAQLCDEYNNIFPMNIANLQYDSIPMDAGASAYLCEYFNNELTRILYLPSPALTKLTVIELGTLFVAEKYYNAIFLPPAMTDYLPNSEFFRNTAMQIAGLNIKNLVATYGYPAQCLEFALNPTTVQAAKMIEPEKIVVLEKPVIPVVVEEQKIIEPEKMEPEKSVIPVVVEERKKEIIDSDNESDLHSEQEVDIVEEEPQQKDHIKAEKNKPKKIKQNKPKQNNDSVEPSILVWAYQGAMVAKQKINTYINNIDENKTKKIIRYSTFWALNQVVLNIAESNGLIDRHELWGIRRSRVTPGAFSTVFFMFCASASYIYAVRKIDQPIQNHMVKAAFKERRRHGL